MGVFERFTDVDGALRGAIVAIGNFDGVHRGHAALLQRAVDEASRRGAKKGVLTFEPHPAKLLAPELAPKMLMTPAAKVDTLTTAGIDDVLAQRFTREFASMLPDAFVRDVLIGALDVGGVVVGEDFSFGRGGKGSVALLRVLMEDAGRHVFVVEPVREGNLVCSSTHIRRFLLEGKVAAAARLLGRPFALSGEVVHGDGRGRQLGFPTANVDTDNEAVPRIGVYACRARLGDRLIPAVVNIGLRPTFAGKGVRIEAHLLEKAGEFYGERVSLLFSKRLRDEVKFRSVDDLVAQINADIDAARAALAGEAAC